MLTRIYVVMVKEKPHRLVEAGSVAQAIRHCVSKEYSAKAATPKEVAALVSHGGHVEKANEANEQQTNQGEQ